MKYYNDIRDLIGNTPILKLNNISTKEGVNIYAKIEGTSPGGSCKDRVGIYMVEKAEKDFWFSIENLSGTINIIL